MSNPSTQLVETVFSDGGPLNTTLKKALHVGFTESKEWTAVLNSYKEYMASTEFVERVLKSISTFKDESTDKVFDMLAQIREAERLNLELRTAQANQSAPTNVTEEHTLSHADLLDEKDAVLRRIALANCKKHGRVLLQKWHPDREGGDAEVFDLCRAAIKSGDVELVQILLYRFGDQNAIKDFTPDRIADKLKVRTVKFRGGRLYSVFSHYVHSSYDVFIFQLLTLLSQRLTHLKLLNIPGAFQQEEELHEEPDPS